MRRAGIFRINPVFLGSAADHSPEASTFRMKSLTRGSAGCSKNCFEGAVSTAFPPYMNMTLLDTFRAKSISWVTTSIVMPSSASFRITVSTSPISSGSSALVGSSK